MREVTLNIRETVSDYATPHFRLFAAWIKLQAKWDELE